MKVVFLGQGKAGTMLLFENSGADTVEGNPCVSPSGRGGMQGSVYIPAADLPAPCLGQTFLSPGLPPACAQAGEN